MNTSLGIAFTGSNILFSEAVRENGVNKLNHVESININFDFEDSFFRHKSNQKDLTNIASEIQNYVSRRELNVKDAALAIGSSQAFMLTLPIDYSEGRQAMNTKVYWELSNYFPDNYNEYVINTYRLNSKMPCKESDEFLIIAVHKNTLEFIKRIFKMSGINLKVIDIDHFSAEYALRAGYSEQIENKNVLLAGLKNRRVDYGIIQNRKYRGYMYSIYSSDIELNLCIVKKLTAVFEKDTKMPHLDTIFLYGQDIPESTVSAIKKLGIAPVEVLNPLTGLGAAELLLKDEGLRKTAYRFSSSCGAALRCLQ